MLDALLSNGCDFPAMLALLDTNARASTAISTLANTIYARHVAVSDSNPLMALPLDAWRSILRHGAIVDPAPGDPPRTNPYSTIGASAISNARTDMLDILALVPGTKRPTEQWTLVIEPPTTTGHNYDYRRSSNNHLAWLLDSFGNRFILEQGLGLNHGATFTVTGYTDVPAVPGFDTMEIASINAVFIPEATDTDTNANLLDDDWEEFFFGQLGAVNPYDNHPSPATPTSNTTSKAPDPRAGNLTAPVVTLSPLNVDITYLPLYHEYQISWDFPDAYVDAFNFTIQSSTDLGQTTPFTSPAENASVPVYQILPGRYALRVNSSQSALNSNFFRVVMTIK